MSSTTDSQYSHELINRLASEYEWKQIDESILLQGIESDDLNESCSFDLVRVIRKSHLSVTRDFIHCLIRTLLKRSSTADRTYFNLSRVLKYSLTNCDVANQHLHEETTISLLKQLGKTLTGDRQLDIIINDCVFTLTGETRHFEHCCTLPVENKTHNQQVIVNIPTTTTVIPQPDISAANSISSNNKHQYFQTTKSHAKVALENNFKLNSSHLVQNLTNLYERVIVRRDKKHINESEFKYLNELIVEKPSSSLIPKIGSSKGWPHRFIGLQLSLQLLTNTNTVDWNRESLVELQKTLQNIVDSANLDDYVPNWSDEDSLINSMCKLADRIKYPETFAHRLGKLKRMQDKSSAKRDAWRQLILDEKLHIKRNAVSVLMRIFNLEPSPSMSAYFLKICNQFAPIIDARLHELNTDEIKDVHPLLDVISANLPESLRLATKLEFLSRNCDKRKLFEEAKTQKSLYEMIVNRSLPEPIRCRMLSVMVNCKRLQHIDDNHLLDLFTGRDVLASNGDFSLKLRLLQLAKTHYADYTLDQQVDFKIHLCENLNKLDKTGMCEAINILYDSLNSVDVIRLTNSIIDSWSFLSNNQLDDHESSICLSKMLKIFIKSLEIKPCQSSIEISSTLLEWLIILIRTKICREEKQKAVQLLLRLVEVEFANRDDLRVLHLLDILLPATYNSTDETVRLASILCYLLIMRHKLIFTDSEAALGHLQNISRLYQYNRCTWNGRNFTKEINDLILDLVEQNHDLVNLAVGRSLAVNIENMLDPVDERSLRVFVYYFVQKIDSHWTLDEQTLAYLDYAYNRPSLRKCLIDIFDLIIRKRQPLPDSIVLKYVEFLSDKTVYLNRPVNQILHQLDENQDLPDSVFEIVELERASVHLGALSDLDKVHSTLLFILDRMRTYNLNLSVNVKNNLRSILPTLGGREDLVNVYLQILAECAQIDPQLLNDHLVHAYEAKLMGLFKSKMPLESLKLICEKQFSRVGQPLDEDFVAILRHVIVNIDSALITDYHWLIDYFDADRVDQAKLNCLNELSAEIARVYQLDNAQLASLIPLLRQMRVRHKLIMNQFDFDQSELDSFRTILQRLNQSPTLAIDEYTQTIVRCIDHMARHCIRNDLYDCMIGFLKRLTGQRQGQVWCAYVNLVVNSACVVDQQAQFDFILGAELITTMENQFDAQYLEVISGLIKLASTCNLNSIEPLLGVLSISAQPVIQFDSIYSVPVLEFTLALLKSYQSTKDELKDAVINLGRVYFKKTHWKLRLLAMEIIKPVLMDAQTFAAIFYPKLSLNGATWELLDVIAILDDQQQTDYWQNEFPQAHPCNILAQVILTKFGLTLDQSFVNLNFQQLKWLYGRLADIHWTLDLSSTQLLNLICISFDASVYPELASFGLNYRQIFTEWIKRGCNAISSELKSLIQDSNVLFETIIGLNIKLLLIVCDYFSSRGQLIHEFKSFINAIEKLNLSQDLMENFLVTYSDQMGPISHSLEIYYVHSRVGRHLDVSFVHTLFALGWSYDSLSGFLNIGWILETLVNYQIKHTGDELKLIQDLINNGNSFQYGLLKMKNYLVADTIRSEINLIEEYRHLNSNEAPNSTLRDDLKLVQSNLNQFRNEFHKVKTKYDDLVELFFNWIDNYKYSALQEGNLSYRLIPLVALALEQTTNLPNANNAEILACLRLLNKSVNRKGIIGRVRDRSEFILCTLAIYHAFGKKSSVQIITKLDLSLYKPIFKAFGVQLTKDPIKSWKSAVVVYGDLSKFISHHLNEKFLDQTSSFSAKFDVCIVDEADRILLDQFDSINCLSICVPGMDLLNDLLCTIWLLVKSIYSQVGYSSPKLNQLVKDKLVLQFNRDLNYLPDYCRMKIDHWIDNAIRALFQYRVNEHYSLMRDTSNVTRIVRINEPDSQWDDGLIQFLQLKHNLHLTHEQLNVGFISNYSYIIRKSLLYGVSSSLGSVATEQTLGAVYDCECIHVPDNQSRMLIEYVRKKCATLTDWLDIVCQSCLAEVARQRSVVILSDSCEHARLLYEHLSSNQDHIDPNKVEIYEADVCKLCKPGEVTILEPPLPNDDYNQLIVPDSVTESNGGLHLILAYLPMNSRAEERIKNVLFYVSSCEYILDPCSVAFTVSDERESCHLKQVERNSPLLKIRDSLVDRYASYRRSKQNLNANCGFYLSVLDERWAFLASKLDDQMFTSACPENLLPTQFDLFTCQIDDILNQPNLGRLVDNPFELNELAKLTGDTGYLDR